MTLASDLRDDAKTFLESYVLICMHTGSPDAGSNQPPEPMKLCRPADHKILGRGWGKNKPVFLAVPRDTPINYIGQGTTEVEGSEFDAYICPYKDTRTLGVCLGNGAEIMLTAQMDGCSFGIGSPSSSGVYVYHSNRSDQPASQEATQTEDLTGKLGGASRIFSPSNYIMERGERVLAATMVGTRSGNNWRFFAQVYWSSTDIAIRGQGAKNRNERKIYFIRDVKAV